MTDKPEPLSPLADARARHRAAIARLEVVAVERERAEAAFEIAERVVREVSAELVRLVS